MKNITLGITQRLEENPSYYEIREALSLEWGKFLKDINFLPLSYEVDINKYKNKINAFIFSGGNDLYIINENKLNKIRDNYEEIIIKHCITNKIPLLGICRGAQFISSYFNSSISTLPNHITKAHKIIFENKSYFVNSYHNFCITKLSNSLEAIAFGEDSSIEAFKHRELPIFGIMWHIEREITRTIPSKIIWEYFLKEINK